MADRLPLSFCACLRWTARILVACRVSVASAIAGVLLFGLVPQARDLFSDITYGALPGGPRAWLMWSGFFFLMFFVWAFPVHYGARAMLNSNVWMVPRRVRNVVRLAPSRECAESFEADLAALKRALTPLTDWIPRLLGVAPFVAVYFGLYRAYWVVGDAQALRPAAEARSQIFLLGGINLVVGVAFLLFVWKRRILLRGFSERVLSVAAWVSFALTVAIFSLSYLAPAFQSELAPRALIAPLLFGSLVLFATLLAGLGDRLGFPVLPTAILLAFGVTALNKHFNDLRLLPGDPPHLAGRQMEIAAAAQKWKLANRCADGGGCPPALIVAAEGGASRAAFAAATALGTLFDLQREKDLANNEKAPLAASRRVFAISGVSGGAFGAATIRAALWESLERDGQSPPCEAVPESWFRAGSGDAPALVARGWRACLQALVSGDYLTPAFVGLGFRDNLSPAARIVSGPTILKDDRAALIEKAWESHFDAVTLGEKPSLAELFAASRPEPATGLHRPFGYVAAELDRRPGAWLPLLLLNGASVDKGARIIASDLVSTRPGSPGDGPGRAPLYPAAFDLFEMLSTPCPPEKVENKACLEARDGFNDVPTRRDGADARLSTTAMLSARFPIVSPAGTIRAKGDDGRDGDRVVDGGYFENAGLTTALDVARALRDEGVTPIVLWVRNDPTIEEDDLTQAGQASSSRDAGRDKRAITNEATGQSPRFPPRAASTPRLQGAEDPSWLSAFFAVITTPFEALTATRDGHALEAADLVARRLLEMNAAAKCVGGDCSVTSSYFTFNMFKNPRFDEQPGECAALAAAKPRPIMSEVSMSWWLSQSVQAELNSQICDKRNRQGLDDLMKRLGQKLR